MTFRNLFFGLFLCAGLVACDSDSGTTGSSGTSASFPTSFALSSPTATLSSDEVSTITAQSVDAEEGFVKKKESLAALATTAASCAITLPDFSSSLTEPACYGPALDYIFHLDYPGASCSANEADGQLPTGDLGIWSATEADGTACAAAKLNKEIGTIAKRVDMALFFMASVACLIRTDSSLSLPATGASTDLTAAMTSALSGSADPALVISSATVERLTDLGGFPMYEYTLNMVVAPTSIMIKLKHNPTNADGTQYRGRLWSSFESGFTGGPGDSYAFSVLYENGAEGIKYKMLTTGYNASSVTEPFTSFGDVDVSQMWSGGFTQTIANISATTGLGTMTYSWQAGSGDDRARILNVRTYKDGSDIRGAAFFGYGEPFSQSGNTLSDNVIDGFICNWAGPGNSHVISGAAGDGKAQKQLMEVDSSGKFVPSAGGNFITYAPTTSCDKGAGSGPSCTGAGSFAYDVAGSTPSNGATPVANDLKTLSSDTDFASFAAPSAPAAF